MSKALVIKGADFSANKVTIITFGGVPCEGISFAQNSITITDSDPVTVEYTLTPANTTDAVTWVSSDTSVISVANGVLTVNGIGTATLTATCGEFTATATVTVSIEYIPNYQFYAISHAEGKTFASCSVSLSRVSAFGGGTQSAEHGLIASGENSKPPILLPANTSKIRIDATNKTAFYNDTTSRILWATDVPCGDANFPNAATYVSEQLFHPRNSLPLEVAVPSGADAVAIMFALPARQEEGTDPNAFASTQGITIEFLPAAE